MATGAPTVSVIANLCQDGFDPVDQQMLQLLSAHPDVREKVLVPIIEKELTHADSGRRSPAVVSLGMLGASSAPALDALAGVLIDGTVDRRLTALAIRKVVGVSRDRQREKNEDEDGISR